MKGYSRVWAEVNLDAAAANMKAMKAGIPKKTGMIGVVKADGYGHGAVPVAWAIHPYVEGFAVATPEEAMILRHHGIEKMILILGTVFPDRYEDVIRLDLRPPVYTWEQAEGLSKQAQAMNARVKVHLALDTGMSRIGMKPDRESAALVKRMAGLPGIQIEGMFTHFARADEQDKESARKQYQAYQDFCAMLQEENITIPLKHCSNSAGIIEGLESNELDLVRAGISIYGLYPSQEVDRSRVRLTPLLELKSHVAYVKTIEPGTAVSYGGTFVAKQPTRVATIPVGYGDGYPRNLSQKGQVLIRGRKAPILGRVCMDQFMVDVSQIPQVQEGDPVTLIGRDGQEEISVEEVARACGGFHYEICCDLGKRIPRVYRQNGQVIGFKDYFQDRWAGWEKGQER